MISEKRSKNVKETISEIETKNMKIRLSLYRSSIYVCIYIAYIYKCCLQNIIVSSSSGSGKG